MNGHILLITGPREAGKTTLCQRCVEAARQRGWRVTGIVTLGEYMNGERVSLQAQCAHTGEVRTLAHRQRGGGRHWAFVEETLEWGNRVLASAVPTDLLVIDELGPLEWVEGRGWTAGLSAVDSGLYRYALVVVRPELVEHARRRWPHATRLRLDRTPSPASGWRSQAPPGPFIVPPQAAR